MSVGQLLTGILMFLWLALIEGVALYALGPEAADLISIPFVQFGIVALVVLSPVCVGVVTWLWLGDRARPLRAYLPAVLGTMVLPIVAGFAGDSLMQNPEEGSAQSCRWTASLGGTPLAEAANLAVGDSVWIEGVSFEQGDAFTPLWVTGRIENRSEATVTTGRYHVSLLSPDGSVIGQQTGWLDGGGFPRSRRLQSGFVSDFRIGVEQDSLPSVALQDTADVFFRYCREN